MQVAFTYVFPLAYYCSTRTNKHCFISFKNPSGYFLGGLLFIFLTFSLTPAYINAMKDDYMEELARAYNKELRGAENPEIEGAVNLVNEQIYLLSRLNSGRKIVGYILSIKEYVKSTLGHNKTPSRRTLPREGDIARIISLELELLSILDNLKEPFIPKILEYENRVLALLCYLGK